MSAASWKSISAPSPAFVFADSIFSPANFPIDVTVNRPAFCRPATKPQFSAVSGDGSSSGPANEPVSDAIAWMQFITSLSCCGVATPSVTEDVALLACISSNVMDLQSATIFLSVAAVRGSSLVVSDINFEILSRNSVCPGVSPSEPIDSADWPHQWTRRRRCT